ncbi:MAG TPA: lipoate--protein ligase family protein [Nitrospira sp.]
MDMVSFRLLDLTLPSPVENLALDEALLNGLEESEYQPVLRFWESDRHFVVLGRSSSLIDDVQIEVCRQDQVPILRRASGGGTVLQGPGCLSYAVVLPIGLHNDLRDIRLTNRFVLLRIAEALSRWQPAITMQGMSDLTVGDRKIAGSAQRRTRKALLFHGTVLYRMQAEIISRYLKQPKRQPDYRGDRPHGEFLRTINAPLHELKQAIAETWDADIELESWHSLRMNDAVARVVERSACL